MKRSAVFLVMSAALAVSFVAPATAGGGQRVLFVDNSGHATGLRCRGGGTAYTSIQDALDVATPGSTIQICAGIYDEQLVVTTSHLTVRGVSPTLTVIRPSALPVDPGSPIGAGAPRKAVVLVNGASDVRITHLAIDGSHADTGATKFANCVQQGFTLGLYFRNSSGLVASTHTTAIRSAERCSAGIFVERGPGGTDHVTVRGNSVDDFGLDGVVCNGAGTSCTISDNSVAGRGAVDDEAQLGIVIRSGAIAQVTDNRVSDLLCSDVSCGFDPINANQAVGILFTFAGSGTRASENRVENSDIGIVQFASPDCCSIQFNRLENDRYFGIVIQDGNGGATENDIVGGQVGIGVVADFIDTTGVLQENIIRGSSVARVKEFSCCGVSAHAVVASD